MSTTTAPAVRVTIDTEDPTTAPHLTPTELLPPWNGNAVPVVTADAFREFVAAWRANDPNGTWEPDGIREAWLNERGQIVDAQPGDDDLAAWPVLVYDDGEHDDPDVWLARAADTPAEVLAVPAADDAWHTLYILAGWTWVTVPDPTPATA